MARGQVSQSMAAAFDDADAVADDLTEVKRRLRRLHQEPILLDVPPGDIIIDVKYNRKYDPKKVEKMRARGRDWNERWGTPGSGWMKLAAGAILGNMRENGDIVVYDGQHRIGVAKEENVPFIQVLCYDGLNLQQEAMLFGVIQEMRTPVPAMDRYKAKIVADDETALLIRRIAEDHDYTVPTQAGGKTTTKSDELHCHAALFHIIKQGGAEGLDLTLAWDRHMWPGDAEASTGTHVRGLWTFLWRHATEIKLSRMDRIAAVDTIELRKRGIQHRSVDYKISQAFGIYRAMLDIYNKGGHDKLIERTLPPIGSAESPFSTLTQENADQIRATYAAMPEDQRNMKTLGRAWGVSATTVGRIIRNESYVAKPETPVYPPARLVPETPDASEIAPDPDIPGDDQPAE